MKLPGEIRTNSMFGFVGRNEGLVSLGGAVEWVVLGFRGMVVLLGAGFLAFVFPLPPPWPSNGLITDNSINVPKNKLTTVLRFQSIERFLGDYRSPEN